MSDAQADRSSLVWRLILDEPAAGAWNMAVDEAILESVAAGGPSTLRVYRWSEPTLSLGYFQAAADRALHAESAGCALVRRTSGGGAILHDRELTYSLTVPASDPLSRDAEQLYSRVHNAWLAALGALGVEAQLQPAASGLGRNDEPFLCFQRRARGDLVMPGAGPGEYKIGGSAQRRWHNAILQHGSILLEQSIAAPQLPGANELSGRTVDEQSLLEGWLAALGQSLGVAFHPAELSDAERARAAELSETKFGTAAWTGRR